MRAAQEAKDGGGGRGVGGGGEPELPLRSAVRDADGTRKTRRLRREGDVFPSSDWETVGPPSVSRAAQGDRRVCASVAPRRRAPGSGREETGWRTGREGAAGATRANSVPRTRGHPHRVSENAVESKVWSGVQLAP